MVVYLAEVQVVVVIIVEEVVVVGMVDA